MLEIDKLHIVYHVNTKGMSEEVKKYTLKEVEKEFDGMDNSTVNIVLDDGEHCLQTPIEFFWPQYQTNKTKGDTFIDKDKLHIIYYVDITGIENLNDEHDLNHLLDDFRTNHLPEDESVKVFYIPFMGHHEPAVEIFWPPYQTIAPNTGEKETLND